MKLAVDATLQDTVDHFVSTRIGITITGSVVKVMALFPQSMEILLHPSLYLF